MIKPPIIFIERKKKKDFNRSGYSETSRFYQQRQMIMDIKKEIKIMIIGDFLIFRNGLKLLLETENGFKVGGEAADLTEASKLIYRIKPDILLIESAEIDNGNFEAFYTALPNLIPILVLTNSRSIENHQKYLMIGVDGLFSKEENAEMLFKAINQVSKGDIWFKRKLMMQTIKHLVNEKKSIPEKLYSYNCAVLTEREREVLMLICKGMKNRVIADNLFITETTVRHHLTSIFEKLNVNSRLELVVHAFNEKLVEIPTESFAGFNS
jgi:DNA-binding NarL/FixJ family response regulator